ncbi:ArnT family glycosyltransferase [Singulisphaera sp. GP187]|uniref:ArnT family glycosyltransferase n=1 Tax=Singulisphaera sp. GP187 TaxID=1882752 RepID=UPI0020B12810|nr:glycosyltransferase family 39 protein [Singulisphaera sp. GP187]
MSLIQHGVRVGLLMVGVAGLLLWLSYHSDATFADGLRYIHQAERIERGAWSEGLIKSVDHPLHSMAIAAVHRVIGGTDPVSWQRSAQIVSASAMILLVIPLYLLGLEIYGPTTAWIGCLLCLGNPISGFVVINVLSECTFLLFWTCGLWAAVRFLREGRFLWLPLMISFSAFAYLTRPEGMLLPLALVATLLLLPLHWATRIYWPRWWAAVAFLVVGPLLLVGPYMAAKGGLGTKPSIARLLGTAPKSDAMAIERERPLAPNQTTLETYRMATRRMLKVVRTAVSTALLPLVLLGLITARPWSARARVWLFMGVIVVASTLGLIRLHATGGYCTVRHGLVPAMLLTLAAANGIAWLMRSIVIPGQWLGQGEERFRLGPGVWAAILAGFIAVPHVQGMTSYHGSFSAYRDAGTWIAQTKAHDHGKVLDMTDWSLFFSGQPGFRFSEVNWAAIDPNTRWVVVRDAHLRGRWNYGPVVRKMIAGRDPILTIPAHPKPREVQIQIYDRRGPLRPTVAQQTPAKEDPGTPPTTRR